MITLEKHLAAHASVNPGEEDAHLILCHCGTWFDDEGDHRAHVAATWREARTVRTVEELDALLLVGTILRCGYGRVWEKLPGHRRFSGMEVGKDLGVPALVVWTPEDGAA